MLLICLIVLVPLVLFTELIVEGVRDWRREPTEPIDVTFDELFIDETLVWDWPTIDDADGGWF